MPLEVTILVLLAALMHASWNALVKASPSKYFDVVAINVVSATTAAIAIPFLPSINWACWPWLAGSAGDWATTAGVGEGLGVEAAWA